jgi:hypothetical protein
MMKNNFDRFWKNDVSFSIESMNENWVQDDSTRKSNKINIAQ